MDNLKSHMVKKLKNQDSKPDNIANKIKNYSIRIGERLYKRIYKHIQLLKHLNKIQNKQSWLEGAIQDKLEREKELDIVDCISPEKHLSFKISSQIDAKIEKKVEIIKKFRSSFSKKQWVLEAIYEKLDNEEIGTEQKAKDLMKNMLNTKPKVDKTS
jgi:hypothetical protein